MDGMSLKSSFLNIQLQSPLTPHRNIAVLQRRANQIHEYRVWRRRRLKSKRSFVFSNQLGSLPFENLYQSLVSQIPSAHSLDLIVPALGFASGVAIYLSRLTPNLNSENPDIGEWILFTSPTPFNRFVLLRCPSISFQGSELLEDVNDKLVKGDRHFVRLNSGRIQVRDSDRKGDEKLVYQRECVSTDDGGVISLDWPANLSLTEEHGLDTTLLLIPGTADGSMDKNIRSFVCESLERGCFPVVMNPRGCAGSPLTTARLFTAADSDDICTAIQFINRARPWTTLMGVGWGYGANMLTKYLAEVGEKTPLTAATCIDNPFDLEEAINSSPYHIAVDQKLTGGLIDILRSNKELFQGRAKGFDVEKALLATSVRDFEKEISMVSYGFDAIEDFYAKSSTRGVVGNVKIPLLFIQNDDGTVPLFSIPRSLIAENPFTSLLLRSCLPSSHVTSDRSTISWCQNLTIEWLTAVELGLLKGRHPLLKDVDVTINPSKDLALMESRASDKNGSLNELLHLPYSDALNRHSLYPLKEKVAESNTVSSIHSSSGGDSRKNSEVKGSQQENNSVLHQTSSVDAELVKEGVGPVDNETGQGLQTARVVMNMLDVTVPDTLTEEQKKKVLASVGQGETLVKALQEAVPEDVRGKLTTAVSGILHNQRSNLKFDGLSSITQIPDAASDLKSKLQERAGGLSSAEGGNEDPYSSDQSKRADDLADGSNKNQPNTDKPSGDLESEPQASEDSQKSDNTGQFELTGSDGNGNLISGSEKKGTDELGNSYENADFPREKDAQYSENKENGSEIGGEPDLSSRPGGTEDVITDQYKMQQDRGIVQTDMKEDSTIQENEEKHAESSTDQNKMTPSAKTEEILSPSVSSLETQLSEKEYSENQEREEKSTHPVPNQNSSNPPTFDVSQTLDALTGMDDTTQVAVNSVFHVIEDMIDQLEVERDDGLEAEDRSKVEDQRTVSENHHIMNDNKLENKEDNKNDTSLWSDKSDDSSPYILMDSKNDLRASWLEEPIQNPILFGGNTGDNSGGNDLGSHINEENEKGEYLVGSELSSENSVKLRLLDSTPLCITANPYGDSLYKEYLRNYLISKMKSTKSLDLDTTTSLFLDYFPEEGQWKLLEQAGPGTDSISDVTTREDVDRKVQDHLALEAEYDDKIIEPSYVILDAEKQEEPVGEYDMNHMNEKVEINDDTSNESVLVKNIILDSLKVEVGRRLSATDMEEMEFNLARDLDHVANAASLAVGHVNEHAVFMEDEDCTSEKKGTLYGEHIIRAISSAVQDTSYLRTVLPVGVIVGSSLASLRKSFKVAAANGNVQSEAVTDQVGNSGEINLVQGGQTETDQMPAEKIDQKYRFDSSISRYGEKAESKNLNNEIMVGSITTALGASALLVNQQDSYTSKEIAETSSKSFEKKESHQETGKLEEEMSEKSQNNIVTSFAEKAMSVAGPVVPTKEDGKVDQERLVAMLTEWGQKGGMLKLVGKIALLWGGIRGAMSLTEKLISFLRFSERPLFQRILGFVCMVLVLWTPVVVPLLPTLVQSWATHNSSKIAELACIIGLYISILILVMLWGKRVRGYENPLDQYGLDLTSSPKIKNFLKGLIGGVMLVLLIHAVNALLGCVHISLPSTTSLDAVTLIKVYGQMFILFVRGLVTATSVAVVEELLFRSWLPDEIAVDHGYYPGIIISGLAFSLFQRSPWAAPGLLLLSLGLSGARQRCQGSLSLPIGLRSGIMASSFFLQMGAFLTYQPNFSLWLTGTQPFQPFSGIVGVAFTLSLAVFLYPRQPPLPMKKITRTITE